MTLYTVNAPERADEHFVDECTRTLKGGDLAFLGWVEAAMLLVLVVMRLVTGRSFTRFGDEYTNTSAIWYFACVDMPEAVIVVEPERGAKSRNDHQGSST